VVDYERSGGDAAIGHQSLEALDFVFRHRPSPQRNFRRATLVETGQDGVDHRKLAARDGEQGDAWLDPPDALGGRLETFHGAFAPGGWGG
jgi:hypothetical protein